MHRDLPAARVPCHLRPPRHWHEAPKNENDAVAKRALLPRRLNLRGKVEHLARLSIAPLFWRASAYQEGQHFVATVF